MEQGMERGMERYGMSPTPYSTLRIGSRTDMFFNVAQQQMSACAAGHNLTDTLTNTLWFKHNNIASRKTEVFLASATYSQCTVTRISFGPVLARGHLYIYIYIYIHTHVSNYTSL